MKKIIMLAVAALGFTAFAADVGTISISGSVGSINEIEITENDIADELDIIEGESAANVATVTETSNSPTGYTIYMNSVNDSNLVNTSDISQNTDYLVSYDGGPSVSLGTTDMVMKTVGPLGGLTQYNSAVVLAVTGNDTAAPGTYTDLITVSIGAN